MGQGKLLERPGGGGGLGWWKNVGDKHVSEELAFFPVASCVLQKLG